MKCKDCEAICPMRDKSSAGEQECVYQAQIIARPDPIDWFNFRCVAAKDFLKASIQRNGFDGDPKDDSGINRAIQYADELIEQLKKEK